ncbi:MAG: ATP-binding protein [archaeon]
MDLIAEAIKNNPWWIGKEIEKVKGLKKRFLTQEIVKYLDNPQIIAIIGLRRVGKTILMHHIIEGLLSKTDAKRILYFSFDEIMGKDPEIIDKLLNVYENEILKTELKETYVFLDEINNIPDWQVILKRYYDLDKKIKFVVSGSSSLFIKKTKESLAGRLFDFELTPLNFREFLYLRGIEIKDINLQAGDIKKELSNYFVKGGFPELIWEENFEKINKYIKSIIEKIILYDIPKIYKIEESETLYEIFKTLALKPGAIIEYQKIATAFKITYQTASKYVSYLEKSFLIRLLYNYRGSPIARARKSKKIYLGTHCLASAFLSNEAGIYSNIPFIVENIVAANLDAKFFWRKYYEIDILHNNMPIEVKYQDNMPNISGAIKVTQELKSNKAIIITKDIEKREIKENIEIEYIPIWKWLLLESE